MPQYFTRENVRLVDQLAMTRYKIPGVVLMENAARHVADYACAMLGPDRMEKRILAIAGGGNNGGDAMAAARHLHNRNVPVTLALLKPDDSYSGDAKTNLHICRAMNLPIVSATDNPIDVLESLGDFDLILDGIFGTGLSGAVRPPCDELIHWINERECPILAIDIPSGMDCDTGRSLGAVIEAHLTVTFVGLKRGFAEKTSEKRTGRVVVADIGAPRELIAELGQPL